MPNMIAIEHKFNENSCDLKIILKKSNHNINGLDFGPGRHVHNIRNCDIYIDDHILFLYLDVKLYKFKNSRSFATKDLKNIELNYNTKEQCVLLSLPCLPVQPNNEITENSSKEKCKKEFDNRVDLWKLKKITEQCYIRIDNAEVLLKPESNFLYGFASKFGGTLTSFECDLYVITRMPEPNRSSPLQRTIDRDIDEMKHFSRDQCKLHFIELQVPEGHDNPIQFDIDFKDCVLSHAEQCLLHNLTCKPDLMKMPDEYDIMEIDCGLVSILLAICYDIRFTSNETNCESAWTRSMLSPTLTYFETFTSLRDVVISFMRSSIIYPLYRNYILSKLCVEDCIRALQTNSAWILKQFLITHDLFETNESSVFNDYYIDDYVRYLKNNDLCDAGHLQTLAYNLKNILLDVSKKDLGLGLEELETEIFQELITDVHPASSSGDDSEDTDCYHGDDDEITDDMGTESCESDLYTSPDDSEADSSCSDTEEDSVIEQKMEKLML